MVKKRSITRFIILSFLAIIGILLTVCSFTIPYTTTNYNGFINSIPLGLDYSSGVSIVYAVEKTNNNVASTSQAIDNSLSKVNHFLSYHGFSEYEINKKGDDKIEIQILEDEYSSSMLGLLESGQKIFFTVEEASDTITPTSYLNSNDISFAEVSYDQSSSAYGINISLTKLGQTNLEILKKQASYIDSDTVYIYLDEINSSNAYGNISVSKLDKNMFISSSSASNSTTDYSNAYQTASNIFVGTFDVKLEQESMHTVSARLGDNAWLYTLIAFFVFVIVLMVFMWVRYGDLGLLANFAMIFFIVLQFFFMQALPFIRLDFGGALAMFLSLILFAVCQIIICERVGKEYSVGNRIHVSCKNAFKKSFWRIFDLHIVTLVTSIILLLIGKYSISYFGGVIFVASLVSLFTLYVLFRFFVNTYLPLNSTKPKKLKLYREANVKEIKEEIEIIPEDKASTLTSEEGGQL